MLATELLKHEHQVILLVLEAAAQEAERVAQTREVRAERVSEMLDLFHNFADRCHHAKEETLLFVKMAERDPAMESGHIAALLDDHVEGRARLAAVAEALPRAAAGDADALEEVRHSLQAYITLLRSHIDAEDTVVYPLADAMLTEEDQRALSAAFDEVEAEEIGAGVHERYHEMAHRLAAEPHG
jgi:hemerythrin-like domain-containing protein